MRKGMSSTRCPTTTSIRTRWACPAAVLTGTSPHREDRYQAVAPTTAHRPRARKPTGQSLGNDLRGLRFQSEVETSTCGHPLPLRPTVHLAGVVRCVSIK